MLITGETKVKVSLADQTAWTHTWHGTLNDFLIENNLSSYETALVWHNLENQGQHILTGRSHSSKIVLAGTS